MEISVKIVFTAVLRHFRTFSHLKTRSILGNLQISPLGGGRAFLTTKYKGIFTFGDFGQVSENGSKNFSTARIDLKFFF